MKKVFPFCFAFLLAVSLFAACTKAPGGPQNAASSSTDASAATGEPVQDIIQLDMPKTNDIVLAYGCGDLLVAYTYPDDQPMTPYLFSLSEQKAYPILLPLQTDAAQGKDHKIDILAKYGEQYLVTPSVSHYNVVFPGLSMALTESEYTFAFLSKEDLLQGHANYSAIAKMEG